MRYMNGACRDRPGVMRSYRSIVVVFLHMDFSACVWRYKREEVFSLPDGELQDGCDMKIISVKWCRFGYISNSGMHFGGFRSTPRVMKSFRSVVEADSRAPLFVESWDR